MQLNVLKRIGSNLTKLNKLTIFHSFILSHFNFCPLAWHFCSKANTVKIEKIQERALRFIYNDHSSSYDKLLEKAQVPSLEAKRQQVMAIEAFKILYQKSPKCLQNLLTFKDRNYNFRHTLTVNIPKIKTTSFGQKSFRYAAAVLWNNLPEHARSTTDLNTFIDLITKYWDGKKCTCICCFNL